MAARERLRRATATLGANAAVAAPARVLVASHGHPAITRGGAEISAYALYRELRRSAGFSAWFLGCRPETSGDRVGTAITQPFDEREFVYEGGKPDWLKFANRDPNFPRALSDVLREVRPDVVHFHHFIHFGLEAFLVTRRVLPACRIVLTLHEYLAICHHLGQMVTKQRQSLCYRATPEDCHRCFPDVATSDFFLRSLYIKRFFGLVDEFISPSQFLAERFVAWGLPAERIRVIENVIAPATAGAQGVEFTTERPLRIGFFGQISHLKGITVLFDAAARLEQTAANIMLDIHGEYRGQPPEFQADFFKRLKKAGPNVQFHGRYEPERVDDLMRGVDAVVVPSIWWENSPVVIQEALRNRRPVLCSDIGGMAEKVADGVDGYHFAIGSAVALAGLLRRLDGNRVAVEQLSRTCRPPPPPSDIVQAHVAAYCGSDGSTDGGNMGVARSSPAGFSQPNADQ